MGTYDNSGLFSQKALDAMTLVGLMIGIANYDENMSQSDVQDLIKNALNDIHGHLKEQDEKIDRIINLLEGGK